MHMCVSKIAIIGSDYGLWLCRRQDIILTSAGIFLIRTWGTNYSDILIAINASLFRKLHLKCWETAANFSRPQCVNRYDILIRRCTIVMIKLTLMLAVCQMIRLYKNFFFQTFIVALKYQKMIRWKNKAIGEVNKPFDRYILMEYHIEHIDIQDILLKSFRGKAIMVPGERARQLAMNAKYSTLSWAITGWETNEIAPINGSAESVDGQLFPLPTWPGSLSIMR